MEVVWKYDITWFACAVQMPRRARVLNVAMQDGQPRMWALVDSSEPLVDYHFRVVGTGMRQPGLFDAKYIGTWQDGAMVWHLFLEGFSEVDTGEIGMTPAEYTAWREHIHSTLRTPGWEAPELRAIGEDD